MLKTVRMAGPASLTEEEVYARAEVLASYSSFDVDGILGFLNASEIGPSEVSSLTWLPVLLGKLVGVAEHIVQPIVDGIVILQSCVRDRLAQRVPLAPPEHEEARWVSFCRGYVSYAMLDPRWVGDASKARYLNWAGAIAGHPELMSARDMTLRELADKKAQSVVLAYEDIRISPTRAKGGARAGRNEPCPCGSGKKFKKCCLTSGGVVS